MAEVNKSSENQSKFQPQSDTRVVTQSNKTNKSSTRSLDGKFSGKGSKKGK